MSQLRELSTPFTGPFIDKAPGKGGGDYVSHSTINERALSVVGPHSFEVVELIRGYAPEMRTTSKQYPERSDAVVGCLARLTCTVDGELVSVVEVGDVDNPAMNLDGANAKNAASDAYKRCWMRLGLGLHLWSQDRYFLDRQLDKAAAVE